MWSSSGRYLHVSEDSIAPSLVYKYQKHSFITLWRSMESLALLFVSESATFWDPGIERRELISVYSNDYRIQETVHCSLWSSPWCRVLIASSRNFQRTSSLCRIGLFRKNYPVNIMMSYPRSPAAAATRISFRKEAYDPRRFLWVLNTIVWNNRAFDCRNATRRLQMIPACPYIMSLPRWIRSIR